MKKLLSIILVIVTALGMLTLCACSKHEHEYDTAWQSDATSHWHACTGKDCTEIADKADHVYDHACDTTCNVCQATRTISYTVVGEDPIDEGAGWVGAENISGVAGGQYVFKIEAFDSQYPIFLTKDRMDWTPNANNIASTKYTLRFFDKDFNELTADADFLPDVAFLDKDGKNITESYEGKTIYLMVELKEAITFCPIAN